MSAFTNPPQTAPRPVADSGSSATRRQRGGRGRAARRRRTISNVLLLAISLVFGVPFLWLVVASFDGSAGLGLKMPAQFTVQNFIEVMTLDTLWRPMLNSLVLSLGTALGTVVVAVLAAYPLSRYQIRINQVYMYVILFASGLPIIAMMIPVYSLFVSLGLIDSMTGTTLFLIATSLPMAVFMMKNFMDGVPVTVEEAAWVDGATRMQALRRIVVPLLGPGIATVAIFVFVLAWGNFFVPFILLLSPQTMPLAVTIYGFFGQHGSVGYGQIAAYSLLYTLPAILLYLFITRKFGIFALAGGVKG